MNKWIAEFDLEDGDTMPEHMDLEYKGVKIDFHCRPKESVLDKLRDEIEQLRLHKAQFITNDNKVCIDSQEVLDAIDKYKAEVRIYETKRYSRYGRIFRKQMLLSV